MLKLMGNPYGFFTGINTEGIDNTVAIRQAYLTAINGAKPVTMPGFQTRMMGIIIFYDAMIEINKSGR